MTEQPVQQMAEPECSMPGFMACECDHITGCQYPGPPNPQPVPPGFHEQLHTTIAVEPVEPVDRKEEPDRHTADTITSDALDALYEQLDALRETELARQLATCDKAFASATLRAARAEAAIARVRSWCDELDAVTRRLANDPTAVHPVAENIRYRLGQP